MAENRKDIVRTRNHLIITKIKGFLYFPQVKTKEILHSFCLNLKEILRI